LSLLARRIFLIALFLVPVALQAQDDRRVLSPNGQLEFDVFVGQPKGGLWPRIGYQVLFRGKPLIATSWMGLDIRFQEPYLAENAGLISSDAASSLKGHYNSLIAHYMQNGSLGRRLDIEIRAYDDAIAFRYIMPRSTPLEEVLIRDEATQFNFAEPGALNHLAAKPDFDLPFVLEQPGVGCVVITSVAPERSPGVNYPKTYLIRSGDGMLTNLARSSKDPTVAFTGTTPLIWPWRVVMVGRQSERLLQSATLSDLNR
jgi:alpha-glucosidase